MTQQTLKVGLSFKQKENIVNSSLTLMILLTSSSRTASNQWPSMMVSTIIVILASEHFDKDIIVSMWTGGWGGYDVASSKLLVEKRSPNPKH